MTTQKMGARNIGTVGLIGARNREKQAQKKFNSQQRTVYIILMEMEVSRTIPKTPAVVMMCID